MIDKALGQENAAGRNGLAGIVMEAAPAAAFAARRFGIHRIVDFHRGAEARDQQGHGMNEGDGTDGKLCPFPFFQCFLRLTVSLAPAATIKPAAQKTPAAPIREPATPDTMGMPTLDRLIMITRSATASP